MFLRIISFICSVVVSAALFVSCARTPQSNILPVLTETEVIRASFDEDDYYRFYPDAVSIDLSSGEPHTVSSSGAYRYSGTLENGSITVNVDKNTDDGTVFIILDNAHVKSSYAPINITEAKKVVLILENGSTNTLTQTVRDIEDTSELLSGALYSKSDLTITGKGSLDVVTDYNDGINARDDLRITDGVITVTAPGDGIVGKDSVCIENTVLKLTAGKDGIRSTNTDEEKGYIAIFGGTFNISANDDCVQAVSELHIQGGDFTLISGGGFNGITGTENDMMNFGGREPDGYPKVQRHEGMPKEEAPPEGEEPREKFGNGGFPRGQRPDGMTPPEDFDNEAFTRRKMPDNIPTELPPDTSATPESAQSQTDEDKVKAINCDGNITITDGIFKISSSHDAVSSVGNIVIDGGNFDISAGDDAIRSDASVTLNGGETVIRNSYEGVEAQNITVNGGKYNITSSDDGININQYGGMFEMSGGEILISAGGDGIDSNGSIILDGGSIVIDTSKTGRMDTPLDFEANFENSGCTITDIEGNDIVSSKMPIHGGFGGNRKTDNGSDKGTNVAIIREK